MSKIIFFYDESEHSRRLTQDTLSANNFADNFLAGIIGYSDSNSYNVEKAYDEFEKKYKKLYTVEGELKSTILRQSKYKSGLVSFKKVDLCLLNDLLDLIISNDMYLYICLFNKIEYIIIQLLDGYKNSLVVDADSLKYSVAKLVSLYRPQNVYDAMYKKSEDFIKELRKFLIEVKDENEREKKRETESLAIEELLMLLENCSDDFVIDWDYKIAFWGFSKYLDEIEIEDYQLIIDKEGNGKTLKAAELVGIRNCSEADSKEIIGLRIVDFIAGISSSFVKSIHNSFEYGSTEETKKLLFLNKAWFYVQSDSLEVYKKLKKVIIEQHKVWYKTYCGNYSDDFLYFICILNYFSRFCDSGEFNKLTPEQHQNNLNDLAVKSLGERFEVLRHKLPIEKIRVEEDGVYYNKQGAKCYVDYKRYKMLPIEANKRKKFSVLSVGMLGKMEKPCVTILENDVPICYLLPDELTEWAIMVITIADMGQNLFPSFVEFGIINKRFYAEIL